MTPDELDTLRTGIKAASDLMAVQVVLERLLADHKPNSLILISDLLDRVEVALLNPTFADFYLLRNLAKHLIHEPDEGWKILGTRLNIIACKLALKVAPLTDEARAGMQRVIEVYGVPQEITV